MATADITDGAEAAEAVDRPPIEDARDELQTAVPEAAETLRELLDADDEGVQIRAAEAILDRAGITKGKRVSATSAAKDVGGESSSSFDDPFEDFI
ncbi:hypothetical protein EL22_12225 [Halostagnicola sp. A56]|uniref:hypothetical protein n=1 Tax=Halostagnicola sp. A56 TaxID=1495067 RepID=UPI0004A19D9E|nr:hypothetical protein [Halostagnicola sp. A56]KDE57430.1 hypothetical protein EL22_12225 [Halostagnicola sp. A56]